MGIGVGGALVATGGAAITVFFPTVASGAQIFAVGALAFNMEAMIFAPFYAVELEPIEWISDS